jgi:hypothetical protein
LRSASSLSIGVGPRKLRVENFADRCGVAFCGSLDELVIGLQNGLIVGGNRD